MHNILIVDDEERDLNMLAMLLEHHFHEPYQLFFATSALEAFSEIKEYAPTLIFADIRMPGMSGLELLDLVKSNKSIYPVIVSAYSDFTYAREAMQANVRDYLLKPVRAEELRTALDKYLAWYYRLVQQKKKRESLTRQINDLTHMLEKDIISAVVYNQDYRDRVADYLNMTSISYSWGISMVLSIGTQPAKKPPDYARLAGLRSDICRMVDQHRMQSISAFLRDNIIFFLFSRSDQKHQFLQRVHTCILKISGELLTTLEESVQLAMGEPFASNEEMQYSYRVCMSKLLNSAMPSHLRSVSQTDTAQHIAQNIRAHKYHEANALLSQTVNAMAESAPETAVAQAAALLEETESLLFGKARRTREDYALAIGQPGLLHRTAFALLCELEDAYSQVSRKRQEKLVEEMRQFIDEKYSKQLSLTGLSQKFNMNSYYISKLFKTYTNQTFVEYLTQVRVAKAAQLITENRHTFKEISNMVGYNDPSYFSKVFKKVTGKSPREYGELSGNSSFPA